MNNPRKRPISRDVAISKHIGLLQSLLRDPPHRAAREDRIKKAAGSCAMACKLSNETFAGLVKRLRITPADIGRLEKVGVRGYFDRHGASHLYRPPGPTKARKGLAADELYGALMAGKATAEQQRDAAAWIRWLSDFVPDREYEKRRDAADDLM